MSETREMLIDVGIKTGAQFSECRVYRYALWRTWNPDAPYTLFIGLNPSTADETEDDPTIRRCIGFAKTWNTGGIVMVNLFAFRATRPADMKAASDPVGPENNRHLQMYGDSAGLVVAAWGNHGEYRDRHREVFSIPLSENETLGDVMQCLGTTKRQQPKHPLYIKGDTALQPFQLLS